MIDGSGSMAMTFTIGFSSHRPETLPMAERIMAEHDHVVIEEPPTQEFSRMLAGTLPVEDYLLTADYEFQDFAAASCRMLQRLNKVGKRIISCEPFMARLIRIHEHFGEGGPPSELAHDDRLWPVYEAERQATKRLLTFYSAAATDDFDLMVEAACAFAAADAARFALRDRLRAHAIARLLADHEGNVYVEAGYLHLRLLRELRRQIPLTSTIQPLYLLRDVYRAAGYRSHLYNPGDLLTLMLIFDRPPTIPRQHLLAARSLVYNQLSIKEEMASGDDRYPDAHDDLFVIQYVNRLSFDDCRHLYGRIAGMAPHSARQAAGGFPVGRELGVAEREGVRL
jgi:hypothetical protein